LPRLFLLPQIFLVFRVSAGFELEPLKLSGEVPVEIPDNEIPDNEIPDNDAQRGLRIVAKYLCVR
jgi:hypothetical protein